MKKIVTQTLKQVTILCGILLFSKVGNAQVPDPFGTVKARTDEKALIEKGKEFSKTMAIKKMEAIAYAKAHDLPVYEKMADGNIMEIFMLDKMGNPVYRTTCNAGVAGAVSTNLVWPMGGLGYALTGKGTMVGEWDGGAVLASHQEFGGRVTQMDSPAETSEHATHVAGTMIAAGVNPDAKGMAYEAELHAYDWDDDINEMAKEAAGGLLLSNHSYGWDLGWVNNDTSWYWGGEPGWTEDWKFGWYSSYASAVDYLAYKAPYYLIVKSAGNDRDDGPGSSPIGIPKDGGKEGWDLIGDFGVAKNVLTVAASVPLANSYEGPQSVVIADFSSFGPVDDGRIKPDITGIGVDIFSTSDAGNDQYTIMGGTSLSSCVTGSLVLLQQHYMAQNNTWMKAATLKALAIHTADEAGDFKGPDYMFGWGLLNTAKAVEKITEDKDQQNVIDELTLDNGGTYTRNIEVPGGKELKVTIAWTDPSADEQDLILDNPAPVLVNDLDLKIKKDGKTYYPWKLDKDNPGAAATRDNKNDVDNVEQVVIDSPGPGTYTIEVGHAGSLVNEDGETGGQAFSMIISGINEYQVAPDCVSRMISPVDQETGVSLLAKLEWKAVHGAMGYEVYLGTDGAGSVTPINLVNGDTVYNSYIEKYLQGNQTYYIQVVPVNKAGKASGCPIWSFATVNEAIAKTMAPFDDNFDTLTVIANNWINGNDDDIDWLINKGKTPSSATGPQDDVDGGGNYLYVEASGQNPNKKASLYSDYFDLSGMTAPYMKFYYHMYCGQVDAMGKLAVDVYASGEWHNNMFIITGNQGDKWHSCAVDLAEFKASDVVQVRINGVTGAGPCSDICMDKFEILEKKAEPSNHATNIHVDMLASSMIKLTWTDASGGVEPDGYLIKIGKTTLSLPEDGTAYRENDSVKYVFQGDENVTFDQLEMATDYMVTLYPFTNNKGLIDYKTDGTPLSTSQKTLEIAGYPIFSDCFDGGDMSNWDESQVANYTGGDEPVITLATGDSYLSDLAPSTCSHMMVFNSSGCNSGSEAFTAMSEGISTVGMENVMVSFDWFVNDLFYVEGQGVQVYYSTNAGGPYAGPFFTSRGTTSGWVKRAYMLPQNAWNAEGLKIWLIFTSGNGVNCFLDNVRIYVDDVPGAPGLTTSVDSVGYTAAKIYSFVTLKGGSDVTARGVVWATTQYPTVKSNEGITHDGTGLGEFMSKIDGLSNGTFYYVRAYAVNATDTGYSNQLMEPTLTDLSPVTVHVANGQLNATTTNMEYVLAKIGKEPETWKSCSNTTTDITSDISLSGFDVYVRDANYQDSIRYISTVQPMADAPNVTIADNQVSAVLKLDGNDAVTEDNLEMSVNGSPYFDVITGNFYNTTPDQVMIVRVKVTDSTLASAPTSDVDHSGDIDLSGVDIHVANGQITTTTTAMEYSLNSLYGRDGDWSACTDANTSVTYSNEGNTVWVREAANTENFSFVKEVAHQLVLESSAVYSISDSTMTGLAAGEEWDIDSYMFPPMGWQTKTSAIEFHQGYVVSKIQATQYVLESTKDTIGYVAEQAGPPEGLTVDNDESSTAIIRLNGNRITTADNMEYSLDDSYPNYVWADITDATTVNLSGDHKLLVRYKATQTALPSHVAADIDLSGESVDLTPVTVSIKDAGIKNTTTAMEYSMDSQDGRNGTWSACANTSTDISSYNKAGNFPVFVRSAANTENIRYLLYVEQQADINGKSGVTYSVKDSAVYNLQDNMNYRFNNGTWTDNSVTSGIAYTAGDVEVYIPATDTTVASTIDVIGTIPVQLGSYNSNLKYNILKHRVYELGDTAEYRINGGNWSTNTTGVLFEPGNLEVRVAANDGKLPSVTDLVTTIADSVNLVSGVAYNIAAGTISGLSGSEQYRMAGGDYSTKVTGVTFIPGRFEVRVPADSLTLPSRIDFIGTIAEVAAAPNVSVTNDNSATAEFYLDGNPVVTSNGLEYKMNGSGWTPITTALSTDLTGDNYLVVRKAATASAFASDYTDDLDLTDNLGLNSVTAHVGNKKLLSTTTGMEYSLDSKDGLDGNWNACTGTETDIPEIMDYEYTGCDIWIRSKVNALNVAHVLKVAAKGEVHSGVEINAANGTITGLDGIEEYSMGGDPWTTNVSSVTFKAGIFKVHTPTTESAFESWDETIGIVYKPESIFSSMTYDIAKGEVYDLETNTEYRIAGGSWGTTASGVQFVPGNVEIRKPASQFTLESDPVVQSVIADSANAPGFTINYLTEKTNEIADTTYEYSLNNFATSSVKANNAEIGLTPGTTLSVRKRATSSALPSKHQGIAVPQRPAGPVFTIDYVSETTNEILGDTLAYSADNFATSEKTGTGTKLNILPGTTYKFRYKVSGSSFKSDTSGLDAGARPLAPTGPVVEDNNNTFDFTFNSSFDNATDYEYSVDNGATWVPITVKPFNVGNVSLDPGYVKVRVAASNDVGNQRFYGEPLSSDKAYTLTTGIMELPVGQIAIYPNPSTGKFYLDMGNVDVQKMQVRLFDGTGNLVKIIEPAHPVLLQIDLTNHGKGLYVIQLAGKEFNITEKVIVQ